MGATIVGIIGTLLGALVAGGITVLTNGRSEATARATDLRRERLTAVTDLSEAVSAHRRAMYMRGEARLNGEPEARVRELRAESHVTRGAVSAPLIRVRLLIQDAGVRAAVDAMLTATYGMRRADGTTDAALTREGLTAARLAAVEAHDRFVDAVAAYLG